MCKRVPVNIVCVCVCVCACVRTCVHAYMRTCVHAYMRTCVRTYVRMYDVCMYSNLEDRIFLVVCVELCCGTGRFSPVCIQLEAFSHQVESCDIFRRT